MMCGCRLCACTFHFLSSVSITIIPTTHRGCSHCIAHIRRGGVTESENVDLKSANYKCAASQMQLVPHAYVGIQERDDGGASSKRVRDATGERDLPVFPLPDAFWWKSYEGGGGLCVRYIACLVICVVYRYTLRAATKSCRIPNCVVGVL